MHPHFDHEARIAMMQAHDEARELGHPEVGADHVLLGLMADVRGAAYAVLAKHGLQYAAARELVLADHAARPADTHDEEKAPETVEDDLDADREALLAIGIDLDKLRDTVRERFGSDLTEGWGERRSRGQGRGARRGDPGRRGPGRRGGQGFGPGGPGFGPSFGPGDPEGPFRGRDDDEDERAGGPDPGSAGPGGRGRRGPRSGRFGGERLSPAMREVMIDLVHTTRADAFAERGDRRRGPRGPQLSADRLLLAVLRSDDPVVTAVVATAADPGALRAEVESMVGHSAV